MTADDSHVNGTAVDTDHSKTLPADHNSSSSDHSRHDVREFVDKLEHMPVGYAGDGNAAVEELPGVHHSVSAPSSMSRISSAALGEGFIGVKITEMERQNSRLGFFADVVSALR